jgi:hypothetical protein
MAIVEWGFNDDYIKTRTDIQRPGVNLLPIRSNEHVNNAAFATELFFFNLNNLFLINDFFSIKKKTVVCCSCIGAKYLVVGEKSGLLSVYKMKKDKNQIVNCLKYF